MNLLTDRVFKRILIMVVIVLSCQKAQGQYVVFNADQCAIIESGTIKNNKQINAQTRNAREAAVMETMIGLEFQQIKNWERKYSEYLKNIKGYAEQLKAGTTLYATGVDVLMSLRRLEKAVEYNPEGVAASISMTDLYIEVCAELGKVYTLLQNAVAEGGSKNMMTTAERTRMLWELDDELSALASRLKELSYTIAYLDFQNLWNWFTVSFRKPNVRNIAEQCYEGWRKSIRIAHNYSTTID
jgi:hypothetical protein